MCPDSSIWPFPRTAFIPGCVVVVVEMGESVAKKAAKLPQPGTLGYTAGTGWRLQQTFRGARAAGAACGNQETMPIRTIGPVGCGMPPAGSSVTWNHFGGIPSGTFIIQ